MFGASLLRRFRPLQHRDDRQMIAGDGFIERLGFGDTPRVAGAREDIVNHIRVRCGVVPT